MFTDTTVRASKWQRRAEVVGFTVWKNRKLTDMTDVEIKAAFDGLAKECGISYIWAD